MLPRPAPPARIALGLAALLVALPAGAAQNAAAPARPVFDRPERLFTGRAVVDSEARPTGVALGGVGTGRFDLCTDGSIRHVSIGPVQPMVERLPGSFLELSAGTSGETSRALVLGGAGGLPGVAKLLYRGIFPRAFLDASDPALPVRASIEAWSPFVPHDVAASSLPAVAFDVRLDNVSAAAVTARLVLHWPQDPALATPVALAAAAEGAGRVERGDDAGTPSDRIAVRFELAPGASGRATLVVGWDAPTHRSHARLADAAAAAHELLARHDELHAATREWQALLFDSDLPGWYAERLCNDLIPLVANTRLPADGPFAMAEAAAGLGGILGTLDQRLIAHVATQAFFPELDREELAHFAARQRPDGEIAHHLGSLDGTIGEDEGFLGWPDLAASFVCQVWQHQRWTGDGEFADAMAAPATAALRWLLARDVDGDGIADGGSTFDYRLPEAGFVYTASLGAAALEAGRRLATERGDDELAAACAAGVERARAALVGRLWNGRWFARSLDAAGERSSSDCFLGQLAGEWYAATMGWPPLVPSTLRDRALEALVALNGAAPHLVPPLDVRADGTPSSTRWSWLPHVSAFYCAPLIAAGRTDTALQCLQRLDWSLVESAQDPWRVGLYADCDTGVDPKPDYGWYMSTPASWWTVQALSGVTLDVPAGTLRLAPQPPSARRRFAVPVFAPALTARLTVEDQEHGVGRTLRLSVLGVYGGRPLRVRSLVVQPPPVADASTLTAEATLDGAPLPLARRTDEPELVLELREPVVLDAGATLIVALGEPGSAALGAAIAARQAESTAVLENDALRVVLERDELGLRRLTLVDRARGGEARFDVRDAFRVALPASAGGIALDLCTDPSSTRMVRVRSARHAMLEDADGQLWTLEQVLAIRPPGPAGVEAADDAGGESITARLEVRVPRDRAAVRLSLQLRGAALARVEPPRPTIDFPRLELLDPGTVGETLVLHAAGVELADAARLAAWAGEWSVAADGEPIAIGGPVPDLLVRWVGGDGSAHRLAAHGDEGRHLCLEPSFRTRNDPPPGDTWTSGGSLEIALRPER
jgi:uncharacterized protein (DUF608 family)